jgi:transketolase
LIVVETVQRVHARNVVAWGKEHLNALVLSGDLTVSCEVDGFRDAFPDRFFSMGLMEQNMMSFAAGLAREGMQPMVHTFAVFMYRRALDQIEMSIAYPNLPVWIFGFLPGVTTPGGPTHQAINDISVMSSLPNMTVIETGDATDVESVLDAAAGIEGPVYIRMVRGELRRLFDRTDGIRVGRARVLSEGSDIALLTTGICTEEALRVVGAIRAAGVSIQHLHVTTLKPFNDPSVVSALANARYGAIAMENHTINGGLASAVATVIAEHGMPTKLVRLGLRDCYLHGSSRTYLMRRYGIDAEALVRAVERLTGEQLNIGSEEIAEMEVSNYVSEKQQEAL